MALVPPLWTALLLPVDAVLSHHLVCCGNQSPVSLLLSLLPVGALCCPMTVNVPSEAAFSVRSVHLTQLELVFTCVTFAHALSLHSPLLLCAACVAVLVGRRMVPVGSRI